MEVKGTKDLEYEGTPD